MNCKDSRTEQRIVAGSQKSGDGVATVPAWIVLPITEAPEPGAPAAKKTANFSSLAHLCQATCS